MFRYLFFACLAGFALASRSANQYMDNVIQTSLAKEVRGLGLDPAALTNFYGYFGPQNVYGAQGVANFTQGNATGISQVRRSSECQGPLNYRGEITINCTLSIFPVSTSYKMWIRNGTSTYLANAVGRVDNILVHVVISGQPQNYIGSVKSFTVTRSGQVNPQFTNFPKALSKYSGVLLNAYKTHVTTELNNIIYQRFVYAIGRAIAYKPMPRQ